MPSRPQPFPPSSCSVLSSKHLSLPDIPLCNGLVYCAWNLLLPRNGQAVMKNHSGLCLEKREEAIP